MNSECRSRKRPPTVAVGKRPRRLHAQAYQNGLESQEKWSANMNDCFSMNELKVLRRLSVSMATA